MIRAKKGMTLDQVRELWAINAKAKEDAIMAKYHAMKQNYPSFGRAGLSVWEGYRDRVTEAKVQMGVSLLQQAGFPVTCAMIDRVTGQASKTILGYWSPPEEKSRVPAESRPQPQPVIEEEPPPPTYQFPRLRC
jgi:hypothetical protein